MKSKSHRLVRGLEVLVLSLASLAVACAGAGSEKPVTAAAADAAAADAEPEADEAPPEEVVSDPQTAAILRSVRQDAEESRAVSEEEEERLAADAELLTPPDGEWLVDETGREYFLRRLPKSEPWYWADKEKGIIRYKKYELHRVVEEGHDYFEIGVYRPEKPQSPYKQLDEEELAAIAATYAAATGEADLFELRPFDRGLPKRGQWRNGFGFGDMNGDGHLDLVHAPPRGGSVSPVILLGDGSGGWAAWSAATFPRQVYAYGDAAAADLDGDGHQDLVVAMHLNGLMALRGDGAGGFEPWGEGLDHWQPSSNQVPGFSSRAVELVDWNGDGRPDILALGEGPRPRTQGGGGAPEIIEGSFGVALYLNQGDGTWRRTLAGDDTRLFGDALALGDFNGDGRTDFVTSSGTIGLRRLVHFGEADGSWRSVEVPEVRRRAFVRGVAAGDFDGDGRDDVAMTYTSREGGAWRSGVDVLYAGPDETWERLPLQVVEGDRAAYFDLAAGDLDGDGRLELVVLDGEGSHLVFVQRGERAWVRELAPEVAPLDQGCRGYEVELVDLDGDGRDELVEEFAGEPNVLIAPDACRSRGGMRAWKATPAGS